MRYVHLIEHLKTYAADDLFINEVTDGDIYENLNSGEHKYPNFNITVNSCVKESNVWNYNITLFYTDRLIEDCANKNSVTDNGIMVLQRTLNAVKENFDEFDYSNVQFIPFTQKFNDLCGGVYCTVSITTYDEIGDCAYNFTSPYMLQSKDIEITENGETTVIPDSGYYGLRKVNITTNVPEQGIPFDSIIYKNQTLTKDRFIYDSDDNLKFYTLSAKTKSTAGTVRLYTMRWLLKFTNLGLRNAQSYFNQCVGPAGTEKPLADWVNDQSLYNECCGFFTEQAYNDMLSWKPDEVEVTLYQLPLGYRSADKKLMIYS